MVTMLEIFVQPTYPHRVRKLRHEQQVENAKFEQ